MANSFFCFLLLFCVLQKTTKVSKRQEDTNLGGLPIITERLCQPIDLLNLKCSPEFPWTLSMGISKMNLGQEHFRNSVPEPKIYNEQVTKSNLEQTVYVPSYKKHYIYSLLCSKWWLCVLNLFLPILLMKAFMPTVLCKYVYWHRVVCTSLLECHL